MAKNKKDGPDAFEGLFGRAEKFQPVNPSGNENTSLPDEAERGGIDDSPEKKKEPVGPAAGDKGEGDTSSSYDGGTIPHEEPVHEEPTHKEPIDEEPTGKEPANEEPTHEEPTNDGIVSAKERRETRSKTIQIKLQPSLYAEAKDRCNEIGISFNEGINQLIIFWLASKN